jgi:hypothetical protein
MSDVVSRLTRPCGRVALFDLRDEDLVAPYRWRSHNRNGKTSYVVASLLGRPLLMHRLIAAAPVGVLVDHEDRNGLNNCRRNLRLATVADNAHNQRARGGSSRFKGVWWHKHHQRWRASITHHRKKITLGHFTDEEDAARCYDAAALRLFGEFARLNFPSEVTA